MRRVGVATERRAHAMKLVGRDTRSDAAATDENAYLSRAAPHRMAYGERVIRVIIRSASVVRSEVCDLVPRRAQFFNHPLVEREASVICADGDSHRYYDQPRQGWLL